MTGFSRKNGVDKGTKSRDISSLAVTAGDLLTYDRANEVVIAATSSTAWEDLAGVAIETKTTSDTSVLIDQPYVGDIFEVDTTNNSDATHKYQRMALTDKATVNNTGTDDTSDNAYVMQVGTVGAASDKKILVEFISRMDRA